MNQERGCYQDVLSTKKTDKMLAIQSSYSTKIEGHATIMFPHTLVMERVCRDNWASVY